MTRDRERRAASAPAGYTLVELLVVVVILSILASIAGAASGSSGTQHLDMAEIQIRDGLAWAQALARSSRAPVGVVFDAGQDRYALVDEDGALLSDPLTRGHFVVSFRRPNQPRLVDVTAADFGACGVALVFDAQGVPMTGGTVTLVAQGQTRVLTVNAATGSVAAS